MPGEEPVPLVPLELRDAGVSAHVGVQRLFLGAEGVEQVQGPLPVVAFVVPLQQDLQRNGDLPGLLEHGAGHETPGEQQGGRDARLDHRQPDADGDHSSRVPDRAADLGQRKDGVQRGPPFRDRLFDQREDEPADDLVVDRFAGLQRPAQVGAGLLGGGGTGPVTAAGELDGGRGEALRRGCRARATSRGYIMCSPPGWPSRISGVGVDADRGRPQDAGDLAEGEFAFEDEVVEALFGS